MEFVKAYGYRANDLYGMGLVRSTSFGRKRVSSFSNMGFGDDNDCCPSQTPLKRHCSMDSFVFAMESEIEDLPREKSLIEDLPQEILIRILCGVEHDDLKNLFFVSKGMREATVIAKQSHFAYSTPRKTVGFKNVDDFGGGFNSGVETPNAPKRSRVPRSRLTAKKVSDISVDLFASGSEEHFPRGTLFIEMGE